MWLVWLPMDVMQGDAGDSGQDSGPGLVGCRGPGILRERGRWSATHLLMYSPVRMTLQVWHLKQLTCHCLSSARSDWPCLISSLHPAQSAKTKVGHLGSLRLPAIIPCHGNPVPDAILPRPPTLVLPVPRDFTRQEERLPELWPVGEDLGMRRKEQASPLLAMTTIRPSSFSLPSPQCRPYLHHREACACSIAIPI